MTNHIYNVAEGSLISDGVIVLDETFTFPAGNYTANSLASQLQTTINDNADPSNFTVSVNANTNLLTISTTDGSFPLTLSSAFATTLGFTSTSLSGASSYTGTYPVKLLSPQIIFCTINEVQKKIEGSSQFKTSFFITHSTSYGDKIDCNFAFQKQEFIIDLSRTKTLTFNFTDIDGTAIDFNNEDWILILEKVS